jgi:hypothetical protein
VRWSAGTISTCLQALDLASGGRIRRRMASNYIFP